MTTNAPNTNKIVSFPKYSPSPKPPDKRYPGIHSVHEIIVHPPIPKNKCPYCNFVNDDGSHRKYGKNFASKEDASMCITDEGTIECCTNIHINAGFASSIKITHCPFCKRKL